MAFLSKAEEEESAILFRSYDFSLQQNWVRVSWEEFLMKRNHYIQTTTI